MERKSIAVALITVLLCMVLGSSIACTTIVIEYHLTISSTEGGSVTTPGEGRHHYCEEQGGRVNLVATPDAGYRFDKWTGDVGTIADVNDATTTITVNGDYSITANFEKIPDQDGEIPDQDGEMPEHDLTISSTACGYVDTPGEGIYSYAEGTVVNLVAIPDACCQFVKWTAAPEVTFSNETAAATSFTMPANHVTVTAHFKDVCAPTPPAVSPPCLSCCVCGLKISSTGGGSVTDPGEGVFPVIAGSVVQLVASPDAGHSFLYWSGDVDTIADIYDASTTITMNDWYVITANFNPG
jgi:uncharacterized repeat protein (TIGR02543 family)